MTMPSRRSFLKSSAALAAPLCLLKAQAAEARPLLAYVGTFSSPLRDTLPTQVDLPPGNGRGIHQFRVNRETGALTPAGVQKVLDAVRKVPATANP
jgi:6-phosphogluconolactonase